MGSKTETKRYDQFPQLAELARGMSDEGRALVATWHSMLLVGLDGFIRQAPAELRGERGDRVSAALWVIKSWQRTMHDVAGVLTDTRPADWCCKVGAGAWPAGCPQHGADDPGSLPLGTILRSSTGERAVRVMDESSDPYPWYGIEHGFSYKDHEVLGWTVVYRGG